MLVLEPSPLRGERLLALIDTRVPIVVCNRVSNAGKCRYRADGGGVREHVSSTIEALIANTVGARLQQVPLYINTTDITAGCSSVTLIEKAVTLNEGVRGTRRKGGNVVARGRRDDVHHVFVE